MSCINIPKYCLIRVFQDFSFFLMFKSVVVLFVVMSAACISCPVHAMASTIRHSRQRNVT